METTINSMKLLQFFICSIFVLVLCACPASVNIKEDKMIVSEPTRSVLENPLEVLLDKEEIKKRNDSKEEIDKNLSFYWNGPEKMYFKSMDEYIIYIPKNTKGVKIFDQIIRSISNKELFDLTNKMGFSGKEVLILKKGSAFALDPSLTKLNEYPEDIYQGSQIIEILNVECEDNRIIPAHNKIILEVNEGESIDKILKDFQATVVYKSPVLKNVYVIEFEKGDYFELCKKLMDKYGVKYAKPSFFRGQTGSGTSQEPTSSQNGTRYSSGDAWHLRHLGVEQAHNVSPINVVNEPIRIAILEDHIDVSHEALIENLMYYRNITSESEIPNNDFFTSINSFFHGTAVSGIALAQNKEENIVGICPSCELLAICFGAPLTDGINLEAHDLASLEEADIINFSNRVDVCGFDYFVLRSLDAFINFGRDSIGGIGVYAIGNRDIDNCDQNPLNDRELMLIGASGKNNLIHQYSGHGDCMAMLAPGEEIETTFPQNNYYSFDLTSAATPIVTGNVGLLLQHNDDLSFIDIQNILQFSNKKTLDGNIELCTQQSVHPYAKIMAPRSKMTNELFDVVVFASCPYEIEKLSIELSDENGNSTIYEHVPQANESKHAISLSWEGLSLGVAGRYKIKPIVEVNVYSPNYPHTSENLDFVRTVTIEITEDQSLGYQ